MHFQRSVSEKPAARDFERRIVRRLGLAATALAVLLLLVFGALHVDPGRRYVLARVFKQLRERQIDVTADDVRYNLAALSLSLENARITSMRSPALPPFATVAHGRVNLSMWALVRGRYEIDSANITGLASLPSCGRRHDQSARASAAPRP